MQETAANIEEFDLGSPKALEQLHLPGDMRGSPMEKQLGAVLESNFKRLWRPPTREIRTDKVEAVLGGCVDARVRSSALFGYGYGAEYAPFFVVERNPGGLLTESMRLYLTERLEHNINEVPELVILKGHGNCGGSGLATRLAHEGPCELPDSLSEYLEPMVATARCCTDHQLRDDELVREHLCRSIIQLLEGSLGADWEPIAEAARVGKLTFLPAMVNPETLEFRFLDLWDSTRDLDIREMQIIYANLSTHTEDPFLSRRQSAYRTAISFLQHNREVVKALGERIVPRKQEISLVIYGPHAFPYSLPSLFRKGEPGTADTLASNSFEGRIFPAQVATAWIAEHYPQYPTGDKKRLECPLVHLLLRSDQGPNSYEAARDAMVELLRREYTFLSRVAARESMAVAATVNRKTGVVSKMGLLTVT